MAHFVQAITRYGPRLVMGDAVGADLLSVRIERAAAIDRRTALSVLQALDGAVLAYVSAGTPVLLPGVGRFAPSIKVDGRIRVTYRTDGSLAEALNASGGYRGPIHRGESIGLSPQDFKRLWDADHPDDPLRLAPC